MFCPLFVSMPAGLGQWVYEELEVEGDPLAGVGGEEALAMNRIPFISQKWKAARRQRAAFVSTFYFPVFTKLTQSP